MTILKNPTYRITMLITALLVFTYNLNAQTKGLIFEPATGAGTAVLDPNGDGYVSQTTAGFILNDDVESEIPYVAFVFPGSEPTSDINNGPNCGFSDFVDSGTEDPAMSYVDASNNWLFRMRMGSAITNAKSYSVLIDTDGLFGNIGPSADPDYTPNNPGFEIEIVLATKFGVFVYDVDGIPNCTPVISYLGTTNYQKSIAHSEICGSFNYFLDYFVDFDDLTTQFGITSSTPIQMVIIDNMAANKSTVCNPNSASDIGGVDGSCGNLAACYQVIIDNQGPCSIADINAGLCTDRSDCPSITGPINDAATAVSGTTTEADGTTIDVYKNGLLIGSTTSTGGTWTLSGIAPPLAPTDTINATATAVDEVTSYFDCNTTIVGSVCTDPILTVVECNADKAFSGTGLPGAEIKVYLGFNATPENPASGNLFTPGAINTITVDGTGSWLWRCLGGGQTTSCTAGGGPCLVSGNYRITQTLPGQCESLDTWICVNLSSTTTTPVITTTPIDVSTTSISGTMPAPDNVASDIEVIILANGVPIGSTITTAGGAWTISPISLNPCDVLTVQAIRDGGTPKCVSAESAGIVVAGGASSPAPEISGTYCTSGPITTITGISQQSAGSTITIYENGILEGTTTVLVGGVWTANIGISIAIGSTITATVTSPATCESESGPSSGILVSAQSTNAVAITTSPIIEQMTSVSGTGTDGDVITLYVDGFQIPGFSTIVTGGVWTFSGFPTYELYTNGVVTATAETPGFCPSAPTASEIVVCIPPTLGLTVNPDSEVICTGSFVANVDIISSESLIIYQLFLGDGITPTGTSVLGTGSDITLTSGILTASTTLMVKALKIPPGSCEAFLSETISLTVNAVPDSTLTITASSTICSGSSTNVSVDLSELGFSYQLRDDATDLPIGGAVAGTGGTILLPTGNIFSTITFNVLMTGVAPSSCSNELLTLVTINVVGTSPNSGTSGLLTICAGSTVTAAQLEAVLTGEDAGGSWSPAFAGAGVYTYTITATAPCTVDASSTVTVSNTASTDTDGDGLTDCEETTGVDDPSTPDVPVGTTDPNDPCDPQNSTDTDGDGLTDCEEITGIDDPSTPDDPTTFGAGPFDETDPCDPIGINTTDTDGDGLTDCEETTGIDDPSTPDVPTTFGAGPFDETDPCDPIGINTTDTDGDGLTDCEETTGVDDPSTPDVPVGTTDPTDPCDPQNSTDTDGDGLTNCEEITGVDDPSTPDVPVGTTDPNDPCDPQNSTDTDGDGLTDCEETTGIDDPSTPDVPVGTTDPTDPCDPNPCDFIIPNGFTPDGDNYNDLFVITGLEKYPENSIIIFNRWGNKVFAMDGYDNTWDGTVNVGSGIGGDDLPTGTYFYILDTKDASIGKEGLFQGYIYLQQ